MTPDGIVDAVREVWRSGGSDGALAYRRRLGVEGPARMGVVVQRLVSADVAGVLFTRNPIDGSDELLIESSWGLGEVVVDGRVIPDRYRLSSSGALFGESSGSVTFQTFTVSESSVRGVVRAGTDSLAANNNFFFALSPSRPVSVLIVQAEGAPTSGEKM